MKKKIGTWPVGVSILMCATLLVAASRPSQAQTRTDLRTQGKSPDFSALGPTKPAQTGAVLPTTCGVGEVYFLTTAASGANLMVCAAANAWTAAGSGADSLALQADGSSLGAAAALSIAPGTYISQTLACSSGTCSYQPDVDTTRIPTNAAIQAGQLLAAIATSASSTAYTAVMSANDPLSAYAANQLLLWNVGTTPCAGGPMTLNIDALGGVPLKQADGLTDLLTTQCGANAQVALTYDGVNGVFRGPAAGGGSVTSVTAAGPLTSSGGSAPNISANYRGTGSAIQLAAGPFTANDCVMFDSGGNTADSGAACGAAAPATSTLQPFGNLDNGLSSTNAPGTANAVSYVQFLIPAPGIVFTNIKAFQAGSGNLGHMAVGVYNSSCALVAQSATVAGTGVQTAIAFPFPLTTLAAGSYFVGFSSDNAATTFFSADSGYAGYLWNLSETAATFRIFTGSNSSTTAAGTTTLPPACGTRNALQTQGTKYTPWLTIQ